MSKCKCLDCPVNKDCVEFITRYPSEYTYNRWVNKMETCGYEPNEKSAEKE